MQWCKKYCSRKCQQEYLYKKRLKEWLSGKINPITKWEDPPEWIRRYFVEISRNRCQKCGWGKPNPVNGKVHLELNHKNGNARDNRFKNLELLCPNCHTLTPNYGTLNRGHGRKFRYVR